MLHISDIQSRLKNNTEPKEVTEMREHILSSFSNLEFIEEGHKYYIHNEDGTIDTPISVSGLIKEFEQHVDWDVKAEGIALKEGVTVDVIKRRWKENNLRATNSGTQHHEFGESYMNFVRGLDSSTFCNSCVKQYEEGYLIPCAPKQEAIVKYWEDIFKIDKLYPLLPEVKMYMPKDNKFGIKKLYCGTADITFAIKYKGEWCIIIMDYKTNASLTSGYNQKFNICMLPPFDDMIDQPTGHYSFQLSAYQLMLMNLGYKVIDRKLIWLKDDGNYEKVALPDITDKIIKVYQ